MEIKEYSNGEVIIIWKQTLCQHSGNCVKSLSSVFSPQRRPWIDANSAPTNEIVAAINKCPSGALSYRYEKK